MKISKLAKIAAQTAGVTTGLALTYVTANSFVNVLTDTMNYADVVQNPGVAKAMALSVTGIDTLGSALLTLCSSGILSPSGRKYN